MTNFLSCDWGTSAFRLRLIRSNDLEILGEIKTDQGIAATYAAWRTQSNTDRTEWYRSLLLKEVDRLSNQLELTSLTALPIVLSGMASSSIGMLDLPYAPMPFGLDGSGIRAEWLEDDTNPILIISGSCSGQDVMRGEETKIVGLSNSLPHNDCLCILPGTHSKHVQLQHSMATSIRTFMTGEFFSLLSSSGILADSVEKGDFSEPACRESFLNAVIHSSELPVLHHSFLVRTNHLLRNLPKSANYYYLSGLLIGEELKSVHAEFVYLVGSGELTLLYKMACEQLGIRVEQVLDADLSLIKGQQKILNLHQKY